MKILCLAEIESKPIEMYVLQQDDTGSRYWTSESSFQLRQKSRGSVELKRQKESPFGSFTGE
jgi:hypothetical protein|tara:strand:- start:3877 stop:4062 length:186 start_codon:yes stop_codon:yes gene_type:complete